MPAPSNIIIEPPIDRHRQEWLDSAVDEALIDLNLRTITDHRTINHLLGRKTPKGAAGKQTKEDRTCWAVWGVNPLDRDSVRFGVQIKPDIPRTNEDGKPIKYESRIGKGEAREPLFLQVPDQIWEKIAAKWAVPILPEAYQKGFWQWVLDNPRIPVLITEGAKKSGALLSHGFVAISIAGVSNGQYLGELNPYLAPFCQVSRRVYLAYDSDLHSKQSVRKELDRLGRLIAASGSIPQVMLWEEEKAKGIDDYVSEFGADALDQVFSKSLTFEAYRRQEQDKEKSEPEEIETEQHFNQIAIATIYKNERYICLNDVLHRWTGTHYEPSSDAVEKRRIFKFCNSYKYYDTRLRKYTYRYANDQSVNGVLKWFKASCSVDIEQINPSGLNLLNGVLTIHWEGRTPVYKFKKHDPCVFYTYVSKVNYDPEADPTYCDRLLSVLSPEQQDIFLKVIASSLDTAGVRARVASRSIRCLMMQGTGHNGKDTLREIVKEIMGAVFMTSCTLSDFQSFDKGDKFVLAPLLQSKINWSPENTDALNLDRLQVMKSSISGDSIRIRDLYEKGKDLVPEFAMLFNVNKMPSLTGAQEAIKTRYAILTFDKVFVDNPDPNDPKQLKGDQRFKYDPEFRREKVAPAFLNRLLQALTDLLANGIDYSSCDEAIQIAREDSCHLLRWAKDMEITKGKGQIRIGDLFNSLKQWYVETGVLEIEQKTTGGEKLIWLDEGDRYDPFISAPRLMRKALEKIFPDAKFSDRTMHGVFVIGIQSPKFTISPNFGSFGSLENQNQDTVSNTEHDPNYDPDYFESEKHFGSSSSNDPKSSHDPNDPKFLNHDPQKDDNHAGYVPNSPNDPNLYSSNSTQPALKIGDLSAKKLEIGATVSIKGGFFSGQRVQIVDIKENGSLEVRSDKWIDGVTKLLKADEVTL